MYNSFEEKVSAGMAKVELIDDILVVSEWPYPTYRFRLVEYATTGYFAWGIGSEHMPDGYLPLCRLSFPQRSVGGRDIDADNLLAVKTEGAAAILKTASFGVSRPAELEEFIQKNRNAKKGTYAYEKVKKARAALPFSQQIWSWGNAR